MKPVGNLRAVFMLSVSAAAVMPLMAHAAGRKPPTMYQPPQPVVAGTFVSLEGGLACQFGDGAKVDSGDQVAGFGGVNNLPELARSSLRSDDCGWTGRIGFGQERVLLLGGLFDSWAVFGRHTDFGSHRIKGAGAVSTYYYTFQNAFTGKTESNRTVIDFEVGKNLGVGTGVRLFGGLRYARFEDKTQLSGDLLFGYPGVAPYSYNTFGAKIKNTFEGVGPRIGLTSRARFGGGFGIMVSGSASALFGDIDSTVTATHGGGAAPVVTSTSHLSSSGWITNVEGEAALTLQTSIPGEFAIGARVEAWYGETKSNQAGLDCSAAGNDNGCTRYTSGDKVNWGPFARWKIYLD